MQSTRIRRLENPIRTYDWGSRTAIPELLGKPSPAPEPQAELWMGAHPTAPSRVVTENGEVPLDAWITRDPQGVLGPEGAARFGGKLPFLFKVLAAERPLSVQVHPSLEQARAGFARENAAGVPLDAARRCYRDDNHKPELICALTPFHALCRFRAFSEIAAYFEALEIQELEGHLAALRSEPGREALEQLFRAWMRLDAQRRSAVLAQARTVAGERGEGDPAWRWVGHFVEQYPEDVGALAPLFLNVVTLEPGEAMYLPAGELHSYLGGVGVEIMANSDNVLRGGLTSKHVDVAEVLATLSFDMGEVEKLHPRPVRRGERQYQTPAEEFALSVVDVEAEAPYESAAQRSVEILLCTNGAGRVLDPASPVATDFARGSALLVPSAVSAYRIEGSARLYKATVAKRG